MTIRACMSVDRAAYMYTCVGVRTLCIYYVGTCAHFTFENGRDLPDADGTFSVELSQYEFHEEERHRAE